MLEDRELLAAIVALVVSLVIVVKRGRLPKVPHSQILIVSFCLLAASLVCSVVEVFFWEDVFNFIQHALAPTSLILLAIWSWLTFVRPDGVST